VSVMWHGHSLKDRMLASAPLDLMRLLSQASVCIALLVVAPVTAQVLSTQHDRLRQQTNQLSETHGRIEDRLANLRKLSRALYEAYLFQKRKQDVSDVSISQVLSRSEKAVSAIDKFLAAMTVYVEIADESNRKRIAPNMALLRLSTLLNLDTYLEDVEGALRYMNTAPTANASAKDLAKELRGAQEIMRAMAF